MSQLQLQGIYGTDWFWWDNETKVTGQGETEVLNGSIHKVSVPVIVGHRLTEVKGTGYNGRN